MTASQIQNSCTWLGARQCWTYLSQALEPLISQCPTEISGQVYFEMPSKSLVSSWTTSFVPSGTRPPHAPHKAYPRKLTSSSPRLRVLKRLHWLWKGMQCSVRIRQNVALMIPPQGTSSPRKAQMPSGHTPRRVPSTISIARVTPASRPPPSPSSPLTFPAPSPTSPTAAALLPSGPDTDPSAIKFSELEPGSTHIRIRASTKSASPDLPFLGSSSSSCSGQPAAAPLYDHSLRLLPYMASTASLAAVCGGAGSTTLDAASRLRDFRALVDEMRATLLHRDSREEFEAGNDENDDERERLLWLLEDVMRKVKQLAEKDAVGLGPSRSVTVTDAVPTLCLSPCLVGETVRHSQVTTVSKNN